MLDSRSFNFWTQSLPWFWSPTSPALVLAPSQGFFNPNSPDRVWCGLQTSLWLWDHGNVLCHPIASFFHPQVSLNISRPLRFPRAPHHCACRKFNNSLFIKQSSLFSFWTTNSLLSCLCFSKVLLISLLKQPFYFGSHLLATQKNGLWDFTTEFNFLLL